MDHRSEVREFLTSRRARITPDAAGLPSYGARRVPGLRRGEVAQLAGVSVEYYSRLERGDLSGASDHVLDALARALRLDDGERTHLEDLAANLLGRALYGPMFDAARGAVPNHARFIFLDSRSRRFWGDWDSAADVTVALLHAEAGRDPYDAELTALVGELSTRSDDFRRRWARHDVRQHHIGAKPFHHPVVGDLLLTYESMELPADNLTVVAYGAEPGGDSAEKLRLLASWVAERTERESAVSE